MLYGRADADVVSLQVVLDNGDTSPLELTKGFFLYGIPDGRQPTELLATKEDGEHRVPVQSGMGVSRRWTGMPRQSLARLCPRELI